jgi:hypothetical protein
LLLQVVARLLQQDHLGFQCHAREQIHWLRFSVAATHQMATKLVELTLCYTTRKMIYDKHNLFYGAG